MSGGAAGGIGGGSGGGSCGPGYTQSGGTCVDIDECLTNNGGCAPVAQGGVCTNTVGSRTCACAMGFTGSGMSCTDVNECAVNFGGCASAAQGGVCTNTAGSWSCSCATGYSGNGLSCADVDECLTNNGGCAASATCTNTVGSRTCACNPGTVGDGLTCTVCQRALARSCSSACICEEAALVDDALLDVWAFSPTNVWAVGTRGAVVHYDGGVWEKVSSGTSATLNAAWGMTGTLWVVGSRGTVLHTNNGVLEAVDAGLSVDLRALSGSSPTSVWVGGANGTVSYWDGASWTLRSPSTTGTVNGLAVNGVTGEVVAVGEFSGGFAFSRTNSTWSANQLVTPSNALTSVMFDSASGSPIAVGYSSSVLRRSGSSWSSVAPSGFPSGQYLSRIRDGWIVGNRTLQGFGSSWTEVTAVGGSSVSATTGRTFFSGDGFVLEWNGSTVTRHGERLDARAVWGANGSDVWVAGQEITGAQFTGFLRRWNGSRFVTSWIPPVVGQPVKTINGLWGTAANNVYAVADGEAIYRFDGTAWSTVQSRSNLAFAGQFVAIHGSSASNIWVASYSSVRRFDGVSWSTETPGALSAVAVADVWTSGPNEGWAVGSSGSVPVIARKSGGVWSTISTGLLTGSMRAVWGSSASDVWIGGTGLYRWNGTTLTQVLPPTTAVGDIAGRGPNDVTIISGTGTQHWNGTSWQPVDVGSQFAPSAAWVGTSTEEWYVGRNVARARSN